MEAIIRDSGKHFKVKEGSTIDLEYRARGRGEPVEFGEVLYVGREGSTPSIGSPTIAGAKVVGKVLGTVQGPKLIVAYLRRRKNSRKRVGHRQKFTRVRIESIQA